MTAKERGSLECYKACGRGGGGRGRGKGENQVSFTVTNQNPPTRSVLFIKSAESSETGLVIPICDFLNHVVQYQFSFRNF